MGVSINEGGVKDNVQSRFLSVTPSPSVPFTNADEWSWLAGGQIWLLVIGCMDNTCDQLQQTSKVSWDCFDSNKSAISRKVRKRQL